jgi:hypothetical protein
MKNKTKARAGKLGGKSGTGKSKRRGNAEYYRNLVRLREAKKLST